MKGEILSMVHKPYRLAALVSHPIQYQTPLFRALAGRPEIDLTVLFCSNWGLKAYHDVGFGQEIKWDVPLLEGYKYIFIKNYSTRPSIFSGFFGLMNFGIISELKKGGYDAVVIHGWNYFTYVLAIIIAKFLRKKVMLRGENPLCQEILKPFWKRWIKKIVLQYGLFKLMNFFLYIGKENKDFYKSYGVFDNKLIFTPYCVDNESFLKSRKELNRNKIELKKAFGIASDKTVILFSGKLIDKKRPKDLIIAYEKINSQDKALIYLGDGHLRRILEAHVKEKELKDVYFVGFKNQTELSFYYAMADILVLPSGLGETWGLVVNEAMNFELPIIVSDMTGCSKDLVNQGVNGFIFKTGDVSELANYLEILIRDETLRKEMGKASLENIKEYSYEKDIVGITKALKDLSNEFVNDELENYSSARNLK